MAEAIQEKDLQTVLGWMRRFNILTIARKVRQDPERRHERANRMEANEAVVWVQEEGDVEGD